MNQYKKALVIEGGGSRGVFSFGVIDSFIAANYNPYDLHFGVSNGAVVQLWYLLKTSNYNLDKMLLSASGNYISYKNIFLGKSIMDFERLYEDSSKKFPIDFQRLTDHLKDKNFFVVVSDALTGEAEYVELDESNYVNQLLATGSLPVLMRTPIYLNSKRKFDGGITDPLPVKKAYDMGAREIVIIRTYEEAFLRKTKLENYVAAIATRSYPDLSRALLKNTKVYNEALAFIASPPSDCKITQICPPDRLRSKRATIDPKIMKEDYQIGLNQGKKFLT